MYAQANMSGVQIARFWSERRRRASGTAVTPSRLAARRSEPPHSRNGGTLVRCVGRFTRWSIYQLMRYDLRRYNDLFMYSIIYMVCIYYTINVHV